MKHRIDKNILINEHRIQIVGMVSGENELVCNNTLAYDLSKIPSGVPKLIGDTIVSATEEDLFNWGIIGYNDLCDKLRRERVDAFHTMLIYDMAVIVGDQKQTQEDKEARNKFRQEWLDIVEKVDKNEYKKVDRPEMPDFMKYYEQFKGGVL